MLSPHSYGLFFLVPTLASIRAHTSISALIIGSSKFPNGRGYALLISELLGTHQERNRKLINVEKGKCFPIILTRKSVLIFQLFRILTVYINTILFLNMFRRLMP